MTGLMRRVCMQVRPLFERAGLMAQIRAFMVTPNTSEIRCGRLPSGVTMPPTITTAGWASSPDPSPPHRSFDESMERAKPGVCSPHQHSQQGRPNRTVELCNGAGSRGGVGAPFAGFTSWRGALEGCLRSCLGCAPCRFVSVSLRFASCSLHAACSRLQHDRPAFLSFPVAHLHRELQPTTAPDVV